MAVVIYLNTQKINDFSTQHKEKRWLESVRAFCARFFQIQARWTVLKLLGPVTSDFKAINVIKKAEILQLTLISNKMFFRM